MITGGTPILGNLQGTIQQTLVWDAVAQIYHSFDLRQKSCLKSQVPQLTIPW
jgi:hypothetical protein